MLRSQSPWTLVMRLGRPSASSRVALGATTDDGLGSRVTVGASGSGWDRGQARQPGMDRRVGLTRSGDGRG